MKETCDFLNNAKTYYLATIDGDVPRVRPFGTAHIFEDKLYIQTGKKKDVFKQIEKNNSIGICAMYKDNWIRISAKAIIDDRIEAKKFMLDANPSLRNMYDENDDNTIVLYLKDVTSTIYSFTSEPVIYNF